MRKKTYRFLGNEFDLSTLIVLGLLVVGLIVFIIAKFAWLLAFAGVVYLGIKAYGHITQPKKLPKPDDHMRLL